MKIQKWFKVIAMLAMVSVMLMGVQAFADGDTIRMGLSIHNQSQDYTVKYVETYKELAAKNGVELRVTDANTNVTKQISDIEDLANQGIDVLVFAPTDPSALGQILKQVKGMGIYVVDGESPIDEEDQQYCDAMVIMDNVVMGEVVAEYIAEKFPEAVVVGGLNYPQISAIDDRFRGAEKKWAELGRDDIKMVEKVATDLNAISTYTEDMLMANPEIEAFICLNDDTALTCYATCLQMGRPEINVFGFDASPAAKQSIAAGQVTGSVVNSPVAIATAGFEAALKLAKGEECERYLEIGFSMVSAENIAEHDLNEWE